MASWIKGFAGGIFIFTIVLVPVIIFSALFLYLTAGKHGETKNDGLYITLQAYADDPDNDSSSVVVSEKLLFCQENNACKTVQSAIASCPVGDENPYILIKSNAGERKAISSECSYYDKLQEILSGSTAL